MSKSCTKSLCKGEMTLLLGKYGEYWKCSKCGYAVSRWCSCGGTRELTTYNGQSVARCTACKKYRY